MRLGQLWHQAGPLKCVIICFEDATILHFLLYTAFFYLAANKQKNRYIWAQGRLRKWTRKCHCENQSCCVTELKVPTSGTSSKFNGTGTELVPFQKLWNLS